MRKVEEELVMYRYHEKEKGSLTWATPPETVWNIRIEAIVRQLLGGGGAVERAEEGMVEMEVEVEGEEEQR